MEADKRWAQARHVSGNPMKKLREWVTKKWRILIGLLGLLLVVLCMRFVPVTWLLICYVVAEAILKLLKRRLPKKSPSANRVEDLLTLIAVPVALWGHLLSIHRGALSSSTKRT